MTTKVTARAKVTVRMAIAVEIIGRTGASTIAITKTIMRRQVRRDEDDGTRHKNPTATRANIDSSSGRCAVRSLVTTTPRDYHR